MSRELHAAGGAGLVLAHLPWLGGSHGPVSYLRLPPKGAPCCRVGKRALQTACIHLSASEFPAHTDAYPADLLSASKRISASF